MLEYPNITYADKDWKLVLQEHIQRYKNLPNKTYLYVDNSTLNIESLNITSNKDYESP